MSTDLNDKIFNKETGRWVKKSGATGKAILLKQQQEQEEQKQQYQGEQKEQKEEKLNSQSPKEISIVSYNIHNGWYNIDESENTFYKMIEWLKQINPDVILFQEVTFNGISRKAFEKTMKQLGFIYIAYGFADDLYGNGFFGQTTCSKIKFRSDPISIQLKRDPVENEARNALYTTLSNGLTIVNTHLDVWDHSGTTRLKQLKQLDKVLNENNLFPALVAGDFNTCRRQDYNDKQWKEINKNYDVETKTLDYIAGMGVQDVTDVIGKRFPQSVLSFFRRIDFIFLFDPYQQLSVKKAMIDTKAEFSDHYPVITTVTI